MSILILDETTLAKLEAADGPIELCARDGRRVGFFTPSKPMQYRLEPQISEEEMSRREQRRDGRTLAEIMADLEKRS